MRWRRENKMKWELRREWRESQWREVFIEKVRNGLNVIVNRKARTRAPVLME